MSEQKLVVHSFGVSMDGYAAGPHQSMENPLGVNGPELMAFMFPTRAFRTMQRQSGGETGVDNAMVEEGFRNMGAWILGRNMFGPVRGPWPDESWQGWWARSRRTTCPPSSSRITHASRSR